MENGFFKLTFCLLIILQTSLGHAQQPAVLAIVIDDMGNSRSDLQALDLPTAITFSILPYTPRATKIAQMAQLQGRELLLHIPMQAKQHNDKLGKGALMLNMTEQAFKGQLTSALHSVTNITGINNHMGSTLTEHLLPMQWVMDILDKHGLYFLDSRTTPLTIAESTAKISGVPALHRHVFLDNIQTVEAMETQFQRAMIFAQDNSAVVIIAHPYPITIKFLAEKLKAQQSDIELVALQTLLLQSERLAMAKKRKQLRQITNSDIVNIHPQEIQ